MELDMYMQMVVFMNTRGIPAHHGCLFLLWSRLLRMLHQVSGRSSLCLPGGHHPMLLGSRLVLWLWACGSRGHRGNSWATLFYQHQWPCLAERSVSILFPLDMYLRCNDLSVFWQATLSSSRKSTPLIKACYIQVEKVHKGWGCSWAGRVHASMHKTLRSIPSSGKTEHACIPSTQEVEAEGSKVQVHGHIYLYTRNSQRIIFLNIRSSKS